MKTLTRAEAIENHRKLWNWIADETLRQKRTVEKHEYPPFVSEEHKCRCNCYACEYRKQADVVCNECIIDWGDSILCYNDDMSINGGSPYDEWVRLDKDEYERAAELARQIAELPERKV